MKYIRNISSWLYYHMLVHIPVVTPIQFIYLARLRFYMERRTDDSWPWKWTAYEASKKHVKDFGTPLP